MRALGYLFVVAALGSCGKRDLPPPLDGLSTRAGADAGSDGGGALFRPDAERPPQCNVPSTAVCGCLELETISERPNLYFVLDRSGSMRDDGKWDTVREAVSTIVRRMGPRANFGAAVFPDPELGGCLPGREVMGIRRGDSPTGVVGPTVRALLGATAMAPHGGTPTADTLFGLVMRLRESLGRTAIILATDGGPNCNPNAACDVTRCMLNMENVIDCPPEGPNCCENPERGGPLQCLDDSRAIAAAEALHTSLIPVYVVGVPGSAAYSDVLDGMAQAGGTARDSAPHYYRVDSSDTEALAATLSKIAAKITATCEFEFAEPPEDPSLVNVYFDEKVVPQDGAWSLSGKRVTLEGETCDRVLAGDVLDIRLVAGCPTVLR